MNRPKDILKEVLTSTAYHGRGIVPIKAGCIHHDSNRDLASLLPEERRTSKRKFRKAWRKIARKFLDQVERTRDGAQGVDVLTHAQMLEDYVVKGLGMGSDVPSRKNKRWRRSAVASMINEEVRHARYLLEDSCEIVQSKEKER